MKVLNIADTKMINGGESVRQYREGVAVWCFTDGLYDGMKVTGGNVGSTIATTWLTCNAYSMFTNNESILSVTSASFKNFLLFQSSYTAGYLIGVGCHGICDKLWQ